MRELFAFRSTPMNFPEIRWVLGLSLRGLVRKFDKLRELTCDHDNLSDHLDIMAVAEHFCTMEVARVGMNDQCPVLKAAACAELRAVTFEKQVHRLLAQRRGCEMHWPPPSAIDQG